MKRVKCTAIVLSGALLLAGCGTTMNHTTKGGIIGGGSGAAAGAIIGGLIGKGKGAAIGAAIGAGVGTGAGVVIGKKMDQKAAAAAQIPGAEVEKVTDTNGLYAVKVSFAAGILFGFNSAAYVAEIFRGGIMSVDEGQFEAGRSLGFGYVRTMVNIVLPQAVKTVLPTLLNEVIALLKETSVAGYVAVKDLTRAGNLIRNNTFDAFNPLIAVALIYLFLVILLTKLLGRLERRLSKSDRSKKSKKKL